MNIGIISGFFLLIVLSGCRKYNEVVVGQYGKKVLSEINSKTSSSESKIMLTYDRNDRLVGYTTTVTLPENTSKSLVTIKYNDDNFISEINSNEVYKLKFYYESPGVIEHTEEFDHKGRVVVTHSYHYDMKGFLKEIIDRLHLGDNEGTFIKNSYNYDQNGNLTVVMAAILHPGSKNFVPWRETYYKEYDNKINILPLSMNHPYIVFNNLPRHNSRKITSIDTKTGAILSIFKNEYVYDDYGYPLSLIQRGYFGSSELVTKTTYKYK
ncbi:MAG: hypothetical protein K0R59_3490 [Sphingobacterium sp.]|jgi:hypothetical protein|uniref:hypothetical protein n=1 Tax=unclassified Sphingobacterium TaxID=2609468 RepID=UPI0009869AD8|nr:hypothetical protein [Sphingobacterium sp. CZ-UAM]MDF2518194.1 hypothetical protein [Sphingobacterium sp.]OOG17726.1 hypothetical protein BWD42_10415 [Sphingobacterium sp. CZ-UAM]